MSRQSSTYYYLSHYFINMLYFYYINFSNEQYSFLILFSFALSCAISILHYNVNVTQTWYSFKRSHSDDIDSIRSCEQLRNKCITVFQAILERPFFVKKIYRKLFSFSVFLRIEIDFSKQHEIQRCKWVRKREKDSIDWQRMIVSRRYLLSLKQIFIVSLLSEKLCWKNASFYYLRVSRNVMDLWETFSLEKLYL